MGIDFLAKRDGRGRNPVANDTCAGRLVVRNLAIGYGWQRCEYVDHLGSGVEYGDVGLVDGLTASPRPSPKERGKGGCTMRIMIDDNVNDRLTIIIQ